MQKDDTNTIKNIIISGGGIAGIAFYGALKHLATRDVWNVDNIEHIYATSIGTVIAVMIALQYDWEELDDFILIRPWHRVFKFDLTSILNAIENRGVFNNNIMKEIFKPLLLGKDMDIDITMNEFYDKTGIHCHFICMDLNSMTHLSISHETHPEWKLIDAIYCSCALPICFSPYIYQNSYLCDGGFIANYPVDICLQDNRDASKTLGIGFGQTEQKDHHDDEKNVNTDFNLFDYVLTLLMNLIRTVNVRKNNNSLCKEVLFDPTNPAFHNIYDTMNSKDTRRQLMDIGTERAIDMCLLHSSIESID